MKVFVTGGTGYIGAYLVKRLSDQGHDVHVLIRSKNKGASISFPNVKLFEGNILDKKSIRTAMEGCEQVYHLAACTSVWEPDTAVYYDINVLGTNNILDVAHELKVEKTVVTSTGGVYGPSIRGVVDETKVRDIDFFNEYESSKASCESHVKDYVIRYGMNIVIVNPTRIYGPYMFGDSGSITLMIEKYINGSWKLIPGDGMQVGNYVYIDDVVEGHLKAMEKGRSGENYLLAGFNHTYVDLFNYVREASGKNYKLINSPMWLQMLYGRIQLFKAVRLGKKPTIIPKWIKRGNYHWEVSPQKSIDELGLELTTLKDGVKKTADWVVSKSK